MKSSLVLASAVMAVAAPAPAPAAKQTGVDSFQKVPLGAPQNWFLSKSDNSGGKGVLASYYAPYEEYATEAWEQHVLELCAKDMDKGVASTMSFNSTALRGDGANIWVGYCYNVGPTTPADYDRQGWVSNSAAYTIANTAASR